VNWLVAGLGIALLIVIHEWGHFIVARLCGMRVERFSIGFGKPLVSFKRNETIYQIAPIPLGGFVQITGLNPHEDFDHADPYVYPNRPRWMRAAVLFAGPFANYLTAALVAIVVFAGFGVPKAQLTRISNVLDDMPAAAAGIQKDDVLVEANGVDLTETPLTDVIKAEKGAPIALVIDRNGERVDVTLTPKKVSEDTYQIGVGLAPGPGAKREAMPLGDAVVQGAVLPWNASVHILGSLWRMITFQEKGNVSSIIKITAAMKEAADRGVANYLETIIMLSISLGLFNLLPIPALDGGRLLFLLVGMLGLKEMRAKTEAAVHMVGMLLLFGLMILIMGKEIAEIFTGG
jgi:regulator of sigma E protease